MGSWLTFMDLYHVLYIMSVIISMPLYTMFACLDCSLCLRFGVPD